MSTRHNKTKEKERSSPLLQKKGKTNRKVALLTLAAIIGLASMNAAAESTPDSTDAKQTKKHPLQQNSQAKQKSPNKKQFDLSKLSARDREDILLVMPNASANQEEMEEAIKENNGVVIGQLGQGSLMVLLVKVEHGKAGEVQKKLSADKENFSTISANNREASTAYVPKAPGFSAVGAWHFSRLNLPEAWELRDKNYCRRIQGLIIMDSGLDIGFTTGTDLSGAYKNLAKDLKFKMQFLGSDVEDLKDYIVRKGNLINTMTYDVTDNNGHGTHVATAAAGNDSPRGSIGVHPGIQVCPIRIADGPYGTSISTDDLAVVSAMMSAFDKANAPVNNIRIINISYANMFDEKKHPVLHELFKYWYYQLDGLVFVSAGNDGRVISSKDKPYLNVVSAMGHVKGMELADIKAGSGKTPWKSASGACVDFTAPGEDIQVTDVGARGGMNVSVDGTSFSSPIVAGIASLVLAVNPNLKNYQVEDILKRSAVNTTAGRNSKFGWGMPDAARAVKMAVASK